MGRPFSKKTLVKRALMHVDTPSQPPSMVVASLTRVNDHQQFIQGNARARGRRCRCRYALRGSIPLHSRNIGWHEERVVFKPNAPLCEFYRSPR